MIHDFTSKSRIGRSDFPKLKGHLKIELKDSKGRAVKTIEGDNMITDALKDIFASNYCGALDYRKMLPLYSKMLGGILCFGTNTLDVTSEGAAKDYFIPDNSTHPVIAHAGQTESSYGQADDTKRGSPLDTSMIVQDGSVTLAWEWGSAAGIGTIVSLGLTHSDVGDAGTGSNSQAFKALKPTINATFGIRESRGNEWAIDKIVFFVGADGYGYTFSVNGSTVTIKKIPYAYEETGLVANPLMTAPSVVETYDVSMPAVVSFAYMPDFCYDRANNKLILFYNTSLTDSLTCVAIDLTSKTASSISISPDESVGSMFSSSTQPMQLPFDGTSVYLRRNGGDNHKSNGLLRVNLSSTADQDLLTGVTGYQGGLFHDGNAHKILAGRYCVINNGVLYPAVQPEHSGVGIDHLYDTWGNTVANPYVDQRPGLANFCMHTEREYVEPFVAVSKFYLASKYNLPTPVSKQNGQSMVITYTLTEVS